MSKHLFQFTIGALTTLSYASVNAGEEIQKRFIAQSCSGCHVTKIEEYSIPNLKTLSREVFASRMNSFKNDQIPSTVMGRIAKGYSDEEIILLANYLGKERQ